MARDERAVTAYHESGHAVLAWMCGITVKAASIKSDQNSLGRVEFHFTQEQHHKFATNDPEMLRAMALVGLGGIAADYALWKRNQAARPDETPKGHFQDQRQVIDRLGCLGLTAESDLDAYLGCAAQLVDRADVWAIIDEVARALISTDELTIEQIVDFAKRSPKVDKTFWDKIENAVRIFRQESEERQL